MPEIETEVTFTIDSDKVILHTVTDGDTLVLEHLEFTQQQAATLAWLVNSPSGTKLEIQIKELQE